MYAYYLIEKLIAISSTTSLINSHVAYLELFPLFIDPNY